MHPILPNILPSPITLYRASQLLTRELDAGERHEPGLLGQMLAHLMANAARGDEVVRNLLECLEAEVESVMMRLAAQAG